MDKNLLLSDKAWRNENIYKQVYDYSIKNSNKYWLTQLSRLDWITNPTIINRKLENGMTEWFPDAQINACYNCVDRHANKNPEKVAVIWQSNDFNVSEYITYKQLKENVCVFANTLLKFGLTKKDCITIYMPMIPEAIYACLACTRLGIKYTAIFAGFSPNAVATRMKDCKSNFVITTDYNTRGNKVFPMKQNIDEVRKILNYEVKALVIKRKGIELKEWNNNVDFDYYNESKNVSNECPIIINNSNDPLFILHTSGSAGKPKGITMSTGGFLLFSTVTGKYFFNMFETEIFWCTGDIGWMGGHSYALYSALCNGITSLFYEGIPTYPRKSIFWEIIDKHKVTSFNTAPTALRAIRQHLPNEDYIETSRSSLKYLGVFGEVLKKSDWDWYFNYVGNGKCPIVNMWGQTELGGVCTAPLSNLAYMSGEGHIGKKFFGCDFVLKDNNDNDIREPYTKGSLFIKYSLPGMLIDIVGDSKSINKIYYSSSKNKDLYYTGDEAYYDEKSNYWITGRNDDVLNVSGHRISPIEIEETIGELDIVSEVAIVGYPHEIKGEGIYAFVVLKNNICKKNNISDKHSVASNDNIIKESKKYNESVIANNNSIYEKNNIADECNVISAKNNNEVFLEDDLSETDKQEAKKIIYTHVRKRISPISKPDIISIVRELPKTRSGKILKRVLSKIAAGKVDEIEDITTIDNPDSIHKILDDIKK